MQFVIQRLSVMVVCAYLFGVQTAFALDSDQEQPAILEADNFELDLKTGVRIYRGNVVYRQGSIRFNCDELVTYFNDDDELDKAICNGDPGKFKQRPEGSEDDMLGHAREITIDQVEELVVMKSSAYVRQGSNELSGQIITYDMATETVKAKGAEARPTKTTIGTDTSTASSGDGTEGKTGDQASGDKQTTAVDEAPARPTLTIQPIKKKKSSTE